MQGSVPLILGEYQWRSFGLEAGLGVSDSEAVFSAGGRYYADFWKGLVVTPYLGAGLFLVEGSKSPPAPPPPPNPNSKSTAVEGQGSGLGTVVSLSGGLEISIPYEQLPLNVWAGAIYVPGSRNEDQSHIGSGISVGLKLRL